MVDDKLKAQGRQGFEGNTHKVWREPISQVLQSPEEQAQTLGAREGKLCVISQDARSLILQGR